MSNCVYYPFLIKILFSSKRSEQLSKAPKYRFYFNHRKLGNEVIVYSVWINQNSNQLEIRIPGEKIYARLSKDESKFLIKVFADLNLKSEEDIHGN